MTTSSSNTVPYADVVEMCHRFYTLGKQITDRVTLYGLSNTVLNGICVEVKGARSTTNTAHVAFLALLANN